MRTVVSKSGHSCHLDLYSRTVVDLRLVSFVDRLHGLVVVEGAPVAEQQNRLFGVGKTTVDKGAQVVHVGCFGNVKTVL